MAFHPNLSSVSNLTVTGDLTVTGNFNFGDAGTDILTVAGYIQGSATGNTLVKVGTGTPTQITAPATNDFLVTGETEFIDIVHCRSILKVLGGAIWTGIGASQGIAFSGTPSSRGGLHYATDEGTYMVAGSSDGNGNHQWSLVSGDNYLKDHDRETKATNPTLNIFSATDPDTDNTQYGTLAHDQTDFVIGSGKGDIKLSPVSGSSVNVSSCRLLGSQGADVASANNLTLGTDGNVFEITGTTQIQLISNLGWQNGSRITLWFTAGAANMVAHGTATSGTNITILLDGAGDYTPGAGDGITLELCEIGGTQAWRSVGIHNL